MSDPQPETRNDTSLKNALSFPTLQYAPPDPPQPTLLRGFVTLVVLLIAGGLIGLTIWSLVKL